MAERNLIYIRRGDTSPPPNRHTVHTSSLQPPIGYFSPVSFDTPSTKIAVIKMSITTELP